jgi:hypothetical protein
VTYTAKRSTEPAATSRPRARGAWANPPPRSLKHIRLVSIAASARSLNPRPHFTSENEYSLKQSIWPCFGSHFRSGSTRCAYGVRPRRPRRPTQRRLPPLLGSGSGRSHCSFSINPAAGPLLLSSQPRDGVQWGPPGSAGRRAATDQCPARCRIAARPFVTRLKALVISRSPAEPSGGSMPIWRAKVSWS